MLWIFSQDKQSLISVKEVTVEGKKIVGSSNEWNKALGKYESNERALEILHEIFTKIQESNDISVTYTMPIK
ncbi:MULTISPECIES: hypothetical protein [Bacillaceae]|uniref:hypothetical protein n=1 Tax=Bacillaceae TaxID=186817 RepID=UPI001E4F8C36|nr:hypothetical protein [Bacillus sp. Au-Bac7]MCE4048660.1 hypothetical protein [Bacillus sp. Au-Bac7]